MIKNYYIVLKGVVQECKNWPTILYSKIFKSSLEYLQLRNRVKIYIGGQIGKADLSMFVEIWHHQFYTPAGFEIKSTDTVFDIGANNGFFSAYAAYKANKGRVYAFEPVPYLSEKIVQTKELNGFSHLQIEKTAIGTSIGTSTFYISKDHNGCHSLYERTGESQEITVSVIDLESYCANKNIERIHFLKLDCEGAEYDIITEKSIPFISRTVETISMEFHDTIRAETHEVLMKLLSEAHFTITIHGDYLYAKNTTLL